MTDFILYMTTIGGRVDLEAPDARAAVAFAIAREDADDRPGTRVIALSYRHPDGQFRAMSNEELAQVPGTVAHKRQQETERENT